MFFDNDRQQLRQQYFLVWNKVRKQQQLSPLEQQIALVIEQHPEYHVMFDKPKQYLEKDYLPEFGETNPFLHMALHLAIREQASTNRPKGIAGLYLKTTSNYGNQLDAEHVLMDALAEAIWQMQKNQTPYADEQYLKVIKKHLKKLGVR